MTELSLDLESRRTFGTSSWLRLALFLLLLALGILVAGAAYFTEVPAEIRLWYKIGFALGLGGLSVAAGRRADLRPYQGVCRALFAVSLGIVLAWWVSDWPLDRLGLAVDSAAGLAVAKLSEALPLIAAILLVSMLSGHDLGWLYLRRGRLRRSLLLGAAATVPLTLPFVASGGLDQWSSVGWRTVLGFLPGVLVFSLANAFMEELWFRGSWLHAFDDLLDRRAALWLTVSIFALFHVIAYWSTVELSALAVLSIVFIYLAFVAGVVTQKTGTLWGAVLLHVVADTLFVGAAFAAGNLN